jgi:hypothetical protein
LNKRARVGALRACGVVVQRAGILALTDRVRAVAGELMAR